MIVKIVQREDVVNETVEVGGPSNIAFKDLAAQVERRLGATGKRRHIPLFALKLLPPLVKPFNEVAARRMTLGYLATTASPFTGWKAAADRFGVAPRTTEAYVEQMKK